MWKTVKLEDICQIGDGNHSSNYPKASEVVEKGVPFLRAGNIQGGTVSSEDLKFITPEKHLILKKGHLKEGDVLITNRGEIGKTAVVPKIFEGANLNSQIAWLRPDDRLLSQFLFYALSAPHAKASFKSQQSGTALQQLTIRQIKNLHISYPPLAEQQRIVAKLDAAFAEIDGAIEAVKSQIEYSKDFLDSTIEELFNNKEYAEHRMDDICTFVGGSQPPKSVFEYEKSENNIRLIQIRDYKSDKHIVYIPKDMARRFCNQSDVMIGRYGPPIFQILRGISGSYNVALMKAIPKENILNDYLFYFLKNKKIQNFVINKSTRAAGQSGVNKAALEPYIIHLPPLDIQKFILNKCEKIQNQKIQLSNTYKTKLENLISLKSSILAQELQSEAA